MHRAAGRRHRGRSRAQDQGRQAGRQAIERGLADAGEPYKKDSDAEQPNGALREYWPSTQSYRRVVITAVKLFGVDAEPLLLKIADPDLALLARIEMAQALLKRPHNDWQVQMRRSMG